MELGLATIDMVSASLEYSLIVLFGKSSSRYYKMAVSVAQAANRYEVVKLGGDTFHLAAFGKTRHDVARAATLLQYVSGWKTTQVCGGGKILLDISRTEEVLRCYLKASAGQDWKAHCHEVIDDPYFDRRAYNDQNLGLRISSTRVYNEVVVDEYIFPCRFLVPYFTRRSDRHPSDPINQIGAKATDIGCDWCLYFDAKAYKKVGQRTKDIY